MTPQLVLASASPRRRELLHQLGLMFVVEVSAVAEQRGPGESPADYALRLAAEKAAAVAARHPQLPVLGADTDVVVDDELLGKPRDRAHALQMLERLSGRRHAVYSAVALIVGGRCERRLCVTEVEFAVLTPAQREAYWASGEPQGKAGGYAIQGLGAAFVKCIEGSYSGVMGLPLFETCALLRDAGIEVLAAGGVASAGASAATSTETGA